MGENIYDRAQFQMDNYAWQQEAVALDRKSKIGLGWYRVVILLLGTLAIYFIIRMNSGFETLGFFALEAATAILIRMWLERHRMAKAAHSSNKVLHDYILLKYLRTKKVKIAWQYLMIIVKCNIADGDFKKAADALRLIPVAEMRLDYQATWNLWWAVIAKAEDDIQQYQYYASQFEGLLATGKIKRIYHKDEKLAIVRRGNLQELQELAKLDDLLKVLDVKMAFLSIYFIFMILQLLFFQRTHFMNNGIELRRFAESGILYIFAVLEVVFVIAICVWFAKQKKYLKYPIADWKKALRVVLVVLVLFLSACTVFLGHYGEQELEFTGGKLFVYNQFDYYKEYKVYLPVNHFFRRFLYESDEWGNPLSQDKDDYEDEEYFLEHNTEDNHEEFNQNSEETNQSQEDMTPRDERILKDYELIYQSQFADSGYIMEYGSSARGDSTAVIGNIHLKFYHKSKNEKCDIVVALEKINEEKDFSSDNETINNFYAVNRTTGEVIPAEMTEWNGMGTQEYQDATGE